MSPKRRRLTPAALILAVLSALLLIASRPAQAQTEIVLYNFCTALNCADGTFPESSLTADGKGNLYGTTEQGGEWGYGTVFEISPNGSEGWNETVLYSFCSEGGASCADGSRPLFSSVIFDGAGNLYGTTYTGGANGRGVVFELSPGGESWTETVLYSFAGVGNSGRPTNGLIMDPVGNLYGTTGGAGAGLATTVFELSQSGGNWTEQAFYSVDHQSGVNYNSGLAMDAAGNIFGIGHHKVFELSPNGNGG